MRTVTMLMAVIALSLFPATAASQRHGRHGHHRGTAISTREERASVDNVDAAVAPPASGGPASATALEADASVPSYAEASLAADTRSDADAAAGFAPSADASVVHPTEVLPSEPTALERLCNAGNARACAEYGRALASGRGGLRVDAVRAGEIVRSACEAGAMRGCVYLGQAYQVGRGVSRDIGSAVQLYQRACEGGDMVGCVDLAAVFQGGLNGPADRGRAAELFRRACDGGEPTGCGPLGRMMMVGEGVALDVQGGIELLQRACDGGDRVGCGTLGNAYLLGRNVTADSDRAVSLLQRACDVGDTASCSSLGANFLLGERLPRDRIRGAGLLMRGCNGGDQRACQVVADPTTQVLAQAGTQLQEAMNAHDFQLYERTYNTLREGAGQYYINAWASDLAAYPLERDRAIRESTALREDAQLRAANDSRLLLVALDRAQNRFLQLFPTNPASEGVRRANEHTATEMQRASRFVEYNRCAVACLVERVTALRSNSMGAADGCFGDARCYRRIDSAFDRCSTACVRLAPSAGSLDRPATPPR